MPHLSKQVFFSVFIYLSSRRLPATYFCICDIKNRPFRSPFTLIAKGEKPSFSDLFLERKSSFYQPHQLTRGVTMSFNTSPLESLLAFFIAFASGVLSTIGVVKYVEKVRRDSSGSNLSD